MTDTIGSYDPNTGKMNRLRSLTDAAETSAPVVAPNNVIAHINETFKTYTPGVKWNETKASGDLILADGNAIAASYLVISKDPLSQGTTSSVETTLTMDMPLEMIAGLSISQRIIGQEFSVELVDTDTPLTPVADIAIASISQATTTLSVTTATAHGLTPGMRIGIRGVSDTRLNYQALVVATTPTATTFTATAGPGGTIASVTAGPFANGYVFYRSAMGMAQNGASMVFESATATTTSFYMRADAGDAQPSGTAIGNHSITTASTASVQAVVSPLTYAFQPTAEFRVTAQSNRVQWLDSLVDSVAAVTTRLTRTQICPNPNKQYKVRIRAVNSKSLTVPVAQIVSAAKTGTTTATITTDVAHGLAVGDLVVTYGLRDQTNFPNLAVATAVASIVSPTQFTIVIAGAVTATSYGGYVAKVHGGVVAFGAVTQAAQSVSRASNLVTLIGNTTWSGAVVGDFVNLVGIRNSTDGASVGIDGAYRIRDLTTTTLILEPLTADLLGNDIASVNCGGAVIKRSDIRVSYLRVYKYLRERMEFVTSGSSDLATAVPVQVNNSPSIGTVSTVTTLTTLTGGNAAEDAATTASPIIAGGVVRAAVPPVTPVAGDAMRHSMTTWGGLLTQPHAVPEACWYFNSTAITGTSDNVLAAAAGTSLRRYITNLQVKNTNGTATEIVIKDGSTVIWRGHVSANMLNSDTIYFAVPLKTTANAALNFACITTGANVYVAAQGFTAP